MTFSKMLCQTLNITPETGDLEGDCCICQKHTTDGFKKKFGANFTSSDFVKVKSPNVLDWNNQLHQELCELFCLKLIKITKLEVWRARKTSYSFHLEHIYVDEQDTNFQELDIDSVRCV